MEKRGIFIESTGCYGCQFFSSHDPCSLPWGPTAEETHHHWREGGFPKDCPLKPLEKK